MTWDHKRIRRTFLDYFTRHATLPHREVPSSPIIPQDDPTLLFTNAGMNQFKAVLLGQEKREYTRAASVQKCMRVGGKHNDLDHVGKDGRHLTWFEMLGNWSFGDYYKKATIEMAWDLSVNVYGLDADRIYASVYKDDEESFALWRDLIGLPEKRIYRFGDIENGDEENYWSMGPTGPCGPCTELFYDLGPAAGTGPQDYMGGQGDRFMEFWNNVFMQNNRHEDGTMEPLAQHGVDTGMGMERITMILQGKVSAYETDLFQPIIQRVIELSGADWRDPVRRVDLQVIADHIRSLTFVVSEGGSFSNEGRGYVLRRILRRAVRHGRRLGFHEPFLWRVAPAVAELFEGIYELPKHVVDNTCEALRDEEARFFRTIDRGMARIHAIIERKEASGERAITGPEAFELYDTYGFPVDLTAIEAGERGFTVDEAGFAAAMNAQRERSREAGTFYEDAGGPWQILTDGGGRGFAGYGLSRHVTRVMRWRQRGERVELVLDETPFYAESGGETADHGVLEGEGFRIAVDDVQKINGIIHHFGALTEGAVALTADTPVTALVDTTRRQQKTIHHTATHLLHAALKAIVGPHVQQKGSVVEADRLRFDYSHNTPLTDAQLGELEAWVNARIRRNEAVVKTEGVPLAEARAQGVVALFGEKYGETVRTVRAGGDSFELCGGNHVERTGDIGHLRITAETGVAAGVRRIEAVVGHAADALADTQRALVRDAAALLKTEPARVPQRVEQLLAEVRDLKRALEKARKSGGAIDADALIADATEIGGVPLVAAEVAVDARETLAALVDRIRDKRPDVVVALVAALDDKAAVIAAVGPRLKDDKRFHAGRIVQAISTELGGRGGGRPDFAQGGGQVERIGDAVAAIPGIVARLAG
ncbi:MAG: alanine--tRNA ligase [Myxococcales bacterium]|nr:alanine--tRNA ligase [Myxococcales bacterium]